MDYQEILDDLKEISKQAGQEVLKFYNQEFSQAQQEEFPVTEVDLASYKIISKGLEKYSDIGVLAEETKEDKSYLNYDKIFIVDSLDGTKDFVEKSGDFAIMIALIENNYPVLGVVYKPMENMLYYAIRNQGAFVEKNGEAEQIKVSTEDNISQLKSIISNFHLEEKEVALRQELGMSEPIKSGSAGLKMGLIAEGKAHLYFKTTNRTGEWDTAPGVIIVEEAGGKVTDIHGDKLQFKKEGPYNDRGFIISNGSRHDEIVAGLAKILD